MRLRGGRSAANGSVISSRRAAEAVDLGRTPARAARLAPRAGRLEHVAAQEHALQVRRRDVVAERGGVEVAQLGERERRPARARSRRSCRRACRAGARARRARSRRGRTPARAGRRRRARRCRRAAPDRRPAGTSPRKAVASSRWLGCRSGLAPRPELLEMGDLADVDLRGELAADRAVERLVGRERPAGQGPGAAERLARALPEQRLRAPARAPAAPPRARPARGLW